MENIKVGCIPVRQAVKIESKIFKVNKFIKKNKLGLIVSGVFGSLISIYVVLLINFVNLIKILN